MISLSQLDYFSRVARAGGYNAAQRRYAIPAATLKLAVTSLEEEFGRKLFARVGRGVRITPAGRQLLKGQEGIAAQIEDLRHDLGTQPGPLTEPIRFAAQESYVLNLLPARIRSFLRKHPEATFDIRNDRAHEVARMVAEGEVEFGLANDPGRGLSAVTAHTRFTLRPILIIPREMNFRGKSPTLKTIATLPLILPDRRSEGRRRLDRLFRKKGLTPRIVMETGGYTLIRNYVALGLGASIVTSLVIGPDERKRFRCFDLSRPLGKREGYVLIRRRRRLSAGADLFLKEIEPAFMTQTRPPLPTMRR